MLRMRKGGASYDEIAGSLGVSKTWISRFLRRRDEEQAQLRGPLQPAGREHPADGEDEDDDGAAEAAADGGATTEANITALEQELSTLRVMAQKTLDPLDRTKISTAISQITARLAALRRAEAQARPGQADEAVKRAGYAAADKLRSLIEEALGERLEDEEPEK